MSTEAKHRVCWAIFLIIVNTIVIGGQITTPTGQPAAAIVCCSVAIVAAVLTILSVIFKW